MVGKDTLKTMYFLLLGIFSVYIWNSILNLNAFFEENFNDSNIPKIYTNGYFIMTIFAFGLTLYVDQHFNIYSSIKFTFVAMVVLFNLIYVLCEYAANGIAKTAMFFLLMMVLGVSDLLLNNLCSGLSSRFGDTDVQLFFKGQAFSGLFTNAIMFLDILGSRTTDNVLIYKLFMLIGDVLFVLFMFLQDRFFSYCKNNSYKMRKVSLALSCKIIRRS